MQHQGASQEKSEEPTPRKLRDERKKGNVPKSKELTYTLLLAFAFSVLWLTFLSHAQRISDLGSAIVSSPFGEFRPALQLYASQAIDVFISASAALLIPIALFGLLIEFLQTGPIFALKKILPRLSNLNAPTGAARLLSAGNVMAVLFALTKTLIIACIGILVIRAFLSELVLLPSASANNVAIAIKEIFIVIMQWTVGLFALIMLLDWAYQRYAFNKSMRMSIQEVRDEQKNANGDPAMKSRRRRMYAQTAKPGNG